MRHRVLPCLRQREAAVRSDRTDRARSVLGDFETWDFCDSLSNLSSTVMRYQGFNAATAMNQELSNAPDDIASAWDDVKNEANDWANAETTR